MKSYYAPDRLRLVGKAWEVKAMLGRLVDRTDAKTATLAGLLARVDSGAPRHAAHRESRGGHRSKVIPFR
ncbi:hypothetical protein J31TS4_08410 [Paenibacillus sp. J31TS4]|uniref:Z-ring formation inhibitor MciZ n=1 Tax=Paenibacillus sp. J31TS4 TaxID=2807195 RepID=UPI001B06F1D6|nr:Z-ring formation inhibitor MciZ [Paenibacillus sp. J31TS4]GIP37561.1 hypothetical protein J31TS4_08410 [Paenibacillus sp. J31TS4]